MKKENWFLALFIVLSVISGYFINKVTFWGAMASAFVIFVTCALFIIAKKVTR